MVNILKKFFLLLFLSVCTLILFACQSQSEEMKILDSKILDKEYSGVCGEIVDCIKEGIVVKTMDSAIIITKVKPFGKKLMDASSYVNGLGKDKIIGQVFKWKR